MTYQTSVFSVKYIQQSPLMTESTTNHYTHIFSENPPQYIYYPDSGNTEALFPPTTMTKNPQSVIIRLFKTPSKHIKINASEDYFNTSVQEETTIETKNNNTNNVSTIYSNYPFSVTIK